MSIKPSKEQGCKTITVKPETGWDMRSFEQGDLVVRRNDSQLKVCEIKNVFKDQSGNPVYEITDGKDTWLIDSATQLGTVEEAATVGFIRYGADHPEKGGQVMTDELKTTPEVKIHFGSKRNILRGLGSLSNTRAKTVVPKRSVKK